MSDFCLEKEFLRILSVMDLEDPGFPHMKRGMRAKMQVNMPRRFSFKGLLVAISLGNFLRSLHLEMRSFWMSESSFWLVRILMDLSVIKCSNCWAMSFSSWSRFSRILKICYFVSVSVNKGCWFGVRGRVYSCVLLVEGIITTI